VPDVAETLDRDARWSSTARAAVAAGRPASHLADAGFARVTNLTGGILRWQAEVDPTLPRY